MVCQSLSPASVRWNSTLTTPDESSDAVAFRATPAARRPIGSPSDTTGAVASIRTVAVRSLSTFPSRSVER